MLVRRLTKGLYEVHDMCRSHYRVEDIHRLGAFDITELIPLGSSPSDYRWGIWEQSEGEWTHIDGNPTLKECLNVIETLAAASQLGTEDEDDNEYTE